MLSSFPGGFFFLECFFPGDKFTFFGVGEGFFGGVDPSSGVDVDHGKDHKEEHKEEGDQEDKGVEAIFIFEVHKEGDDKAGFDEGDEESDIDGGISQVEEGDLDGDAGQDEQGRSTCRAWLRPPVGRR